MVSCRICLEALKKPVSLPCGHIFCCDCVIKTVQAIQPYTHLHPCPICRTMYNITPVNMSVVPPNLRSFVTPSIRRVYIDDMGPTEGSAEPEKEFSLSEASCSPSESSELVRLRAENHALRNNCLMWRKRAETHGAANLGLLNFARVVRDQASILARERDELRRHCSALKRKIDDIDDQRTSDGSGTAVTESLLFGTIIPNAHRPGLRHTPEVPAPLSPLQLFPSLEDAEEDAHSSDDAVSDRPRKRIKIEEAPDTHESSSVDQFQEAFVRPSDAGRPA